MDAREEMARLIAWLVQNVDGVESSQIKADIMLLQGAMSQLVTKLAVRNAALAKQCRPRRAKPPKSAPVKGPQKQDGGKSNTDSPDTPNDSDGVSKGLSAIQQGIRQADPTIADQQQALRQQIYGKQNPDVSFQKAAQAIAR